MLGECRLCGSFLDPQLEHGETLSTAEATMLASMQFGGLKLADPGITTEPQSSRLIFSPPLLSQDAVRLWTCVWHPPVQWQPEETQHKQHLIANCLTTSLQSQVKLAGLALRKGDQREGGVA